MTDDKQPKGFGFGDSDDLAALMSQLESIDLDAEVRKLEGKDAPTTPVLPNTSQPVQKVPDANRPLRDDIAADWTSMGLPPVAPEPRRTISAVGLKPPSPSMDRPTMRPPQAPHAEAEVAALREKTQRQAAKFDNYRKRLTREKADAVQFANERLIKDLLPSIDNLSLALEHIDTTDKEQLATGVRMTLDMLMTALGHHGLFGFDSLHTPFDPHHHQALNQVDDPSVASNTIVKVAQRGYKLHDRLLRPALVTVAIGGMPNQTKDDEKPIEAENNQPDVLADDGTAATPHTAEQSNEDGLELDIDVDVVSNDQPASASLNEGAPLPDGDEEYDLGDVQDALDMFLAGEEIE